MCMNKKHMKSPCCGENIRLFGRRRRQCNSCNKTWSLRKKRRGRKLKRVSSDSSVKYIKHERVSSYAKARMKNISDSSLKRSIRRSRDQLLKQEQWLPLPENGQLIIIADAMVKYVEHSWYTFYFMMIREPSEKQAVIAPLFVRPGTETAIGWEEALNTLPSATKDNITVIVCDGHKGLINYARWNNWLIQRCHFHLIARIQSRRSRWKQSRHRHEGEKIYQLVNHILLAKNENAIMPTISKIEEIGWHTKSPDLKQTLLGFVNNYGDYRTYINYPQLSLPRTSNAAESLIGSINDLCYRARGFRTIKSLTAWIIALLKNKKRSTCNGYFQQN